MKNVRSPGCKKAKNDFYKIWSKFCKLIFFRGGDICVTPPASPVPNRKFINSVQLLAFLSHTKIKSQGGGRCNLPPPTLRFWMNPKWIIIDHSIIQWLLQNIIRTLWCNQIGDVVLNGFNMVYSVEDSILEQNYEKQISWELIMKILYFGSDWRKCIIKEIQHITTRSSKNWVLWQLLC